MSGREVRALLGRIVTGMPKRFTTANDDVKITGVIVRVDTETGRAISIERYQYDFDIEDAEASRDAIFKRDKTESPDADNGQDQDGNDDANVEMEAKE